MKDLLLVGIGGFIGSTTRYGIGLIAVKNYPDKFYLGTLSVNLLGCLLIGILSGSLLKLNQQTSLFLVTGICGGFTTFSTFTIDSIKLLRSGMTGSFIIYASISMIGGIILCAAGFMLTNKA